MRAVLRLFTAVILCLLILRCQDDEESSPLKLTGQKISDGIAILNWNSLEEVDGFDIWRVVWRDGAVSAPKLLASVNSLTFDFIDEHIPLSGGLTYYITASRQNEEIKSNEVYLDGATVFYILPHQMKLVPENKLAIVRGYTDLAVINYEEKVIVSQKQFPGKIGTIDIGSWEGKKELYVPCSDKNVYICNPRDLTILDTLKTGFPVESVAVTSNGNIFISGGSNLLPLKFYSRSSLELVSEYPGESDSHLLLQSDTRLLTVNSHSFPPTMSFYTLSEGGGLISKADDPYAWEYEMDGERMKVSAQYIVTSNEGVVYTADDNMTYVTTLTSAGTNQSDFEFSPDGKTVFSAITNQRILQKSIITGNQVSSSSITTKGYPWILARDGNEMIILSSLNPFYLGNLSGMIIIESVSLN